MATIPTEQDSKKTDELSNRDLVRRSRERLASLLQTDAELRSAQPAPESIAILQACGSTIETVAKAFELYAERGCLAERAYEMKDGELVLLPEYRRATYGEVWERVE